MTWAAEFCEEDGRQPVQTWMDNLPEVKRAALLMAVRKILEPQGLDLAGTSWLKPLGQGLYEFRVRHSAEEIEDLYEKAGEPLAKPPAKILLRLFVHFHGEKVILLLNGYDKGTDDSTKRQQAEIATARKRLRAWKLAQIGGAKLARGTGRPQPQARQRRRKK